MICESKLMVRVFYRCWSAARSELASFRCSDHRDNDRPLGPQRTVFVQKQALPSAEPQLASRDRDRFRGPCERHTNMAGHIVRTLHRVRKVSFAFGNQPFEKFLEVTTRGQIGVFENMQAGTGVANKHIHQPCMHPTGANQFRHLVGDLVSAFAFRPDDEFRAIDGEHMSCFRRNWKIVKKERQEKIASFFLQKYLLSTEVDIDIKSLERGSQGGL